MIGIPEGHTAPPSSSTSLVVARARRLTYFSGVSVVVAFVACSRSDRRRRRRSSAASAPRGDASGRGAMLQSTEVGKDVSRVEETTFEEEESI